jgi:hypothetical protein
MNLRSSRNISRFAHCRAIMIIECLVYIAVCFVLLAVAFSAFYKCYDAYKGLHRTADDIARALRIGERWGDDVRTATAALRWDDSDGEERLEIPHKTGAIQYRFAEGALWRRTDGLTTWSQVLDGVKSSRMFAEPRGRVAAWRWELELKSRRQSVKVRPLFSFAAVPQPVLQP